MFQIIKKKGGTGVDKDNEIGQDLATGSVEATRIMEGAGTFITCPCCKVLSLSLYDPSVNTHFLSSNLENTERFGMYFMKQWLNYTRKERKYVKCLPCSMHYILCLLNMNPLK